MCRPPAHCQLGLVIKTELQTDPDGYLLDTNQWNREVAQVLANGVGIDLQEEHWLVVHAAQAFYQQHQLPPVMRPLIKTLQAQHPELAGSLTLMRLFPGSGSPAKRIALIAGLPRPTNCI